MDAPDIFVRVGARLPIVQAPMAGAGGTALAIAAIRGGGVGSLPCALIGAEDVVRQAAEVRAAVDGPINLNFFCHTMPEATDDSAWRAVLAPFYAAEQVTPDTAKPRLRLPFDTEAAAAVEAVRPAIVSFHFGLPDAILLARVRAAGALILGNATTAAEARWLAERGCDAIVAQGFEAGGHAGHFLDGHRPVGLVALVPQVIDATGLPVIAAGGIADARGVSAAIALGAAGVQAGTAYLTTAESSASAPHHALLGTPASADSVFTNLFSGGLARGLRNRLIEALGPIDRRAPPFPMASAALAPLRAVAEADGRADYSPLWAGQAAPLSRAGDARLLTETLGAAALAARKALA